MTISNHFSFKKKKFDFLEKKVCMYKIIRMYIGWNVEQCLEGYTGILMTVREQFKKKNIFPPLPSEHLRLEHW